jgi:hypothetical protein
MQAVGWRGCIAPTNSRLRHCVLLIDRLHASTTPYPPGKRSSVPIGQEAMWAPQPVWTHRLVEKILSPLPGIEHRSHGRPFHSQTRYWLSYAGPYTMGTNVIMFKVNPARAWSWPHASVKNWISECVEPFPTPSYGHIACCFLFMCIGWQTTSTNCGLQRAYCSFPRWHKCMENNSVRKLIRKIRITGRKYCPSAILSSRNLTWADQGENPGHRCAVLS